MTDESSRIPDYDRLVEDELKRPVDVYPCPDTVVQLLSHIGDMNYRTEITVNGKPLTGMKIEVIGCVATPDIARIDFRS